MIEDAVNNKSRYFWLLAVTNSSTVLMRDLVVSAKLADLWNIHKQVVTGKYLQSLFLVSDKEI